MSSGVPSSDTIGARRGDEDEPHAGTSVRSACGDPLEADAARGLHQDDVAGPHLPSAAARPPRRRRARATTGRPTSPRCWPPGHDAGALAHAHEPRHVEPHGEPADRVVLGQRRRRRARASRPAPPRCAGRRPSATRVFERGAHRLGVGVVGVVDDGEAARRLGAPPCASGSAARAADRARRPRRRQRRGQRRGGDGQRVGHVVRAVSCSAHRSALAGPAVDEREATARASASSTTSSARTSAPADSPKRHDLGRACAAPSPAPAGRRR